MFRLLTIQGLQISPAWHFAALKNHLHACIDASKISSAQVLNVKFEELLMSPEKIIGDVSKHCGITFEEGMLDVPIIGSSSGKDSISRGIDSSRSQSWKTGGLNSAELWFCERICKSNMTANKYTFSSSNPNYILIAFYFLLFPVKIFLALLFNLHRMNNIIDTLKRRLKQYFSIFILQI